MSKPNLATRGAGADNDPLNWNEEVVVKPVGVSICVFIDY